MDNKTNSKPAPQVDIALATYNGERYLLELLNSIDRQTCADWHLFAGDDGSTDSTVEILKAFSAAHPQKVTLLPCGNRLGAKANFSKVMSACRSDYVLLADQDDLWLPEKIENTVQLMKEMEARYGSDVPLLVHTDASVCNAKGEIVSRSFWHYQKLNPQYGLKFKNLLVQNVITGCTILVNRPLLDRALPIPPEAVMHDWWLGLAASGFGKISYVSKSMLLYRQHTSNTIGAKRWSLRHAIREWQAGRTSLACRIEQTQRQAKAFRDQHRNLLAEENHRVINEYIDLAKASPIERRIRAAKNGFHKCGGLRTLGFYWSL
jgi:glycosyltransferase involved in cell wall biosynthesis